MRLRPWVFIGFGLYLAASAATIWDAREAALEIQSIAEELDTTDFERDGTLAAAADSVSDLRTESVRLDEALSSPLLFPARVLPIVGRNLAVVRSMSGAGTDIATAAERLIGSALVIERGGAVPDPGDIDELVELTGELRASIASADLGPREGLLRPVADGRNEVSEALGELSLRVADLETGLAGASSLLDGADYVVLVENNAEMQLGSGMPLVVGTMTIADGNVSFGTFTSAEELFPVTGADPGDPFVEANWGFLAPANDFRKLALSARFDSWGGPQALVAYEAAFGQRLDGVVALDPYVLGELLDIVGTVKVDDRTFDGDAVVDYLLRGQYDQFQLRDDVPVRREALGSLAVAVGALLATEPPAVFELLELFRSLEGSRHLRVYSSRPVEQAAWQELGLTGEVPDDSIGVFLLNLGASKLDPYVDVVVELERFEGSSNLQVEINNRADGSLPEYVVGSWERIGLRNAGDYLGRLAIYLPAGATTEGFAPSRSLEVFGPDGGVTLMVTRVEVQAGRTERFSIPLDVPRGEMATVLPSLRPGGVSWTASGETIDEGSALLIGASDG